MESVARERVLIYGWLGCIITLFMLYDDMSRFLTLEIIFPGRVIYHLTSFTLSFPNAHRFRKFVVCGFLSFVPLMIAPIVFYENVSPDLALLMLLQYIFIFVVMNTMSVQEIYSNMKNNFFRMIIYQSEAYIKSTCLISVLGHSLGTDQLTHWNFSIGIAIGTLQLLCAPVIYVLDAFFCEHTPVKQIDVSMVHLFFKCGVFMSSLLLAVFVAGERRFIPDFMFETVPFIAKHISNFYFLIWYTVDSIEYAKYFSK